MMAKFIDNHSLLEEERKSIMKDPSCNAIQDHLKAKGRDRIAGVHLPTLLSSGRIPLHTSLTLRPSKWWGSTH